MVAAQARRKKRKRLRGLRFGQQLEEPKAETAVAAILFDLERGDELRDILVRVREQQMEPVFLRQGIVLAHHFHAAIEAREYVGHGHLHLRRKEPLALAVRLGA